MPDRHSTKQTNADTGILPSKVHLLWYIFSNNLMICKSYLDYMLFFRNKVNKRTRTGLHQFSSIQLVTLMFRFILLSFICSFFHLSASVNEVYGREWTGMTWLSSTETEQSYNSWHVEIPIRDGPSPLCRLREDPPATDKRIWEELMSFFYYCKNKFLLIYVWVTKHNRVDNSRTLSGPTRHMLTHTISWSMWW